MKFLLIMSIICLALNILLACDLCSKENNYASYIILKSNQYSIPQNNDYQVITYNNLINYIKLYDIIFFGEFHGNKTIHKLQETITRDLVSQNIDIALSFEMFERDTQNIIKEYFSNNITEQDFIDSSRAWPNYKDDYKPLLLIAKYNKLPVIAANIPRRIAAEFSRKGMETLNDLSNEDKIYLPQKIHTIDDLPNETDKYKELFFERMEFLQNQMQSRPMSSKPKMMLDNLFLAQCIKDDTMAESIYLFNQEYPEKQVIHFNGSFHSDYFLGTVERLQALNSDLKITVIAPHIQDQNNPHISEEILSKGQFVIILNE